MSQRGAQPEGRILPPPGELMQLMSRPAPLVVHPVWRDARDKVLGLVQVQARLIAILGPAGSGKTTLLRVLAETLPRVKPVTWFSEFSDVGCEFPPDSIVLVDEAERLNDQTFDTLARTESVTIVMTALPPFYGRLQDFPKSEVVSLPRLTDDEAMAFLAEWVAQFGLPVSSLTPEAWERLVAHCRGVARLLVSLLKLALFVAAEESAPRVVLAHVEQAIAIQGGGVETNLAELAGLSPEGASVAGETPDVDVSFADSALVAYEAPQAIQYASADEPARSGPPPASGARKAGRVAAGVCCVALVALVLLWVGPGQVHDRTLLPQEMRGKLLASLSVKAFPPAPAPREASQPVAASNNRVPPSTSVDATEATANQAAVPTIKTSSSDDTVAAHDAAPAVVSPAAATVTLPPGASVRIVVTYPQGDTAAAQRSTELSSALRADGFNVGDPFSVAPRNSKPGVRYYFVQDEGTAKQITDRLGGNYGTPTLARFLARDGLPRPGTIEIRVGHD